jgi:hypothetical protein
MDKQLIDYWKLLFPDFDAKPEGTNFCYRFFLAVHMTIDLASAECRQAVVTA